MIYNVIYLHPVAVVNRLQYANFNGVDNYHFASDLNALCHLVELSRREAISFIESCSIPFKIQVSIIVAKSIFILSNFTSLFIAR